MSNIEMERATKPHFDGTEKSATIPNANLDKQDGLNPWVRLAALEAENTALKSRVAELETLAAEMLEPWRDGNTGYMAGGYILKLKYKRWLEVLEKRGGIERNQNHAKSAKPEASK